MMSRTSPSGRAAAVVLLAPVSLLAACGADMAFSKGGPGGSSSGAEFGGSDIGGVELDGASEPESGWLADVSSPEPEPAGGWWGGEPEADEPGSGPQGCVPQCAGLQCGPDSCGGSCGWCGGFDSCQSGACVEVPGCKPACAGKMMGLEDGCGGVCTGGGMGIGLAPGGAQDVAYFEKLVAEGQVPSADLFPIEGWLNQHDTPLPPPETDRFITLHAFAGLFFDPEDEAPVVALQLGLNSATPPAVIEAGRFNLCVAVDRSGSMDGDDRIGFAKDGLTKLVDSLDADDYLSIVAYSDTAEVLVAPEKLTDPAAVKAEIAGLFAAGSTNLHAGLQSCYNQVSKHVADKGAIPRVILLSDGLPTAGVTDSPGILAMSGSYNEAGIGLTTIGVGSDFGYELMYDLAVGGLGNFYFLDSAEKLVEVFEDEITYLLTPVAENLRIWFSLPDGYGVEEIYGFEYEEQAGEWHLVAPSPQVEIGDDGTIVDEPPPAEPEPEGDDEAPPVGIKTVFASKENGLLMVKVHHPGVAAVKALDGETLAQVHYSYDLVTEATTEAFDVDVKVAGLDYDDDGGFTWFSNATMQRNACILRAGLAMKLACELMAASADENRQDAIAELAHAVAFCDGMYTQVKDPVLLEDVALMEDLMANVCAGVCLDPGSTP